MFCHHCGASIEEGAKFCPECGKKQIHAEPQLRCPFCGEVLEPDSLFCDNCGKKLSAPETVDHLGHQTDLPPVPPVLETNASNMADKQNTALILGVVIVALAVVIGILLWRQFAGGHEKNEGTEFPELNAVQAQESPSASEAVDEITPEIIEEPLPSVEPSPEPTLEPTPEPTLESTPEPVPETAAESEADSTTVSLAEPIPEPTPEITPAPEPAPAPYMDWSAFSTYEVSTLGDFQWATYEVLHGARPDGRAELKELGQIQGGWKCYLVDDPDGQFDSPMERLLNVFIEGSNESVNLTFDWFYVHDTDSDQGFDDNTPDSVYSGSISSGTVSALGPGKVTIEEFYFVDGKEYAIGTFMWEDGVPAAIFLVRP